MKMKKKKTGKCTSRETHHFRILIKIIIEPTPKQAYFNNNKNNYQIRSVHSKVIYGRIFKK